MKTYGVLPPWHVMALLCPSSGAHDYNVDYHIGRFVELL